MKIPSGLFARRFWEYRVPITALRSTPRQATSRNFTCGDGSCLCRNSFIVLLAESRIHRRAAVVGKLVATLFSAVDGTADLNLSFAEASFGAQA